jgi:hypothetical protein
MPTSNAHHSQIDKFNRNAPRRRKNAKLTEAQHQNADMIIAGASMWQPLFKEGNQAADWAGKYFQ